MLLRWNSSEYNTALSTSSMELAIFGLTRRRSTYVHRTRHSPVQAAAGRDDAILILRGRRQLTSHQWPVTSFQSHHHDLTRGSNSTEVASSSLHSLLLLLQRSQLPTSDFIAPVPLRHFPHSTLEPVRKQDTHYSTANASSTVT
jgi:hypothetical protein